MKTMQVNPIAEKKKIHDIKIHRSPKQHNPAINIVSICVFRGFHLHAASFYCPLLEGHMPFRELYNPT